MSEINIESISSLDLKPTDVLVVTVDYSTLNNPARVAARIKSVFKSVVDNPVVVLPTTMKLSKISKLELKQLVDSFA